jgi:DhnA family fructose-bisphosphate aldolase class Ia
VRAVPTPLPVPAVILAADHRARGVRTIENYDRYVEAVAAALAHCDGILASAQPLHNLADSGTVTSQHRTYLSLNRTGLAGSVFELDDRLVASVARAAADGWTGIKHMTRIDLDDPLTAPALELLGRVLEEARAAGLEAIIEALSWRAGAMARDTDSIVFAAVVAHDLGAPVLKVPVPEVAPGAARVDAVARVVASVGVPVLFLGGPRRTIADAATAGTADTALVDGRDAASDAARDAVLGEVRDVMEGGAAGVAIGRALYQDPDPATMARLVADVVHDRSRSAARATRTGGAVQA